MEEYKKHIIECPFFPKYKKFEDKILIRNLPHCECYQNSAKQLMMSKYCKDENDIQMYGNLWIVNITKRNDWKRNQNVMHALQRSPAEIQGCCNTCNRLATAANFICGCLPVPPQLGGPVTQATCRFACFMLVETLREDCESCCHQEDGKCWSCFESWKSQFKKKNPNCAHPLKECLK